MSPKMSPRSFLGIGSGIFEINFIFVSGCRSLTNPIRHCGPYKNFERLRYKYTNKDSQGAYLWDSTMRAGVRTMSESYLQIRVYMTTITLWLLISVGQYANAVAAPTQVIEKFSTEDDCKDAWRRIENSYRIQTPRLVCIPAKIAYVR